MPIVFLRGCRDANFTEDKTYHPRDGTVTLRYAWQEEALVKRGVALWEGDPRTTPAVEPEPEPEPEPESAVFSSDATAAAGKAGLTTADFPPGKVVTAADVKKYKPKKVKED